MAYQVNLTSHKERVVHNSGSEPKINTGSQLDELT